MQSINLISRKNDIEAIRQIVDLGHGEILASQSGNLVPNHSLNGNKLSRLINAGFKVSHIGTNYTTIN
jgi:hypothetical protein